MKTMSPTSRSRRSSARVDVFDTALRSNAELPRLSRADSRRSSSSTVMSSPVSRSRMELRASTMVSLTVVDEVATMLTCAVSGAVVVLRRP